MSNAKLDEQATPAMLPAHRKLRLIELTDGLAIQPSAVAAIKQVGDEQCSVLLKGQSAVDGGFLVDRPYEDVLDEVNAALDPEEDD